MIALKIKKIKLSEYSKIKGVKAMKKLIIYKIKKLENENILQEMFLILKK